MRSEGGEAASAASSWYRSGPAKSVPDAPVPIGASQISTMMHRSRSACAKSVPQWGFVVAEA
eukprot:3303766-Rhodomonas_salina.1